MAKMLAERGNIMVGKQMVIEGSFLYKLGQIETGKKARKDMQNGTLMMIAGLAVQHPNLIKNLEFEKRHS